MIEVNYRRLGWRWYASTMIWPTDGDYPPSVVTAWAFTKRGAYRQLVAALGTR